MPGPLPRVWGPQEGKRARLVFREHFRESQLCAEPCGRCRQHHVQTNPECAIGVHSQSRALLGLSPTCQWEVLGQVLNSPALVSLSLDRDANSTQVIELL